jgi:heat shock protein HspQ
MVPGDPGRPPPDQGPALYHLLAINAQGPYEAYVSEQNLVTDGENGKVAHPQIGAMFERFENDRYVPLARRRQ